MWDKAKAIFKGKFSLKWLNLERITWKKRRLLKKCSNLDLRKITPKENKN